MGITAQIRATLDELVRANYASQQAYEHAASATDNDYYASIFRQFAAKRNQFADELNELLTQLGGTEISESNIGGALRELWVNLKASFTEVDAAFVAECDRSEEATVAAYQDAIQHDLPNGIDELLRRQFTELKGAHERIHRLSAALQQQADQ